MFYIKPNSKFKPDWTQSYWHIRIIVSQPSKFPKPPPNQILTARNPEIKLAGPLITITLCQLYPQRNCCVKIKEMSVKLHGTNYASDTRGAFRFPVPRASGGTVWWVWRMWGWAVPKVSRNSAPLFKGFLVLCGRSPAGQEVHSSAFTFQTLFWKWCQLDIFKHHELLLQCRSFIRLLTPM